jgi:hypothetical protein
MTAANTVKSRLVNGKRRSSVPLAHVLLKRWTRLLRKIGTIVAGIRESHGFVSFPKRLDASCRASVGILLGPNPLAQVLQCGQAARCLDLPAAIDLLTHDATDTIQCWKEVCPLGFYCFFWQHFC